MKKNKEKKNNNQKKGFTVVELVVVIGIFGVVASTFFFNFKDFRNSIQVQNLGQDIALLVKKTQTDSLAGLLPQLQNGQDGVALYFSDGFPSSQSSEQWAPSYGLRFSSEEGNNKKIVYYFDRNHTAVSDEQTPVDGDHEYSDGGMTCLPSINSECIDLIELAGQEYIEKICIDEISSGETCEDSDVTFLDVVFVRPDPTPYITADGYDEAISDVTLHVSTPDRADVLVTLFQTGQLSVR